jgi:hypothetical protein
MVQADHAMSEKRKEAAAAASAAGPIVVGS